MGTEQHPGAEADIARLIAAWRDAGRPVRHVYHSSRNPAGTFARGTSGYDSKLEAMPAPGEPIHFKSVNSAFIDINLEQDLREESVCSRLSAVPGRTENCTEPRRNSKTIYIL